MSINNEQRLDAQEILRQAADLQYRATNLVRDAFEILGAVPGAGSERSADGGDGHDTGTQRGLSVPMYVPSRPLAAGTVDGDAWDQMTGGQHVFPDAASPLVSVVIGDGGSLALHVDQPAHQLVRFTQARRVTTGRACTLSQHISFSPNWRPGVGGMKGKIGFGLGGGSDKSNGRLVTGGSIADTGWSVRSAFDGYQFLTYAYTANRPGMPASRAPLYGQEHVLDMAIEPGATYLHELSVRMNTPGQADGSMSVHINGERQLALTGILFMTGDPVIDRVIFSAFHGGAGRDYAPDQAVWTRYQDVSLLTLD